MPEEIRLVVWDLDQTFWKGTLSEEGVTEYSTTHHEIVIALAKRGIVSSICSKNDFDAVKHVLVERGLWDYFIFPSIDWTPKAPRLIAILANVQLRPHSVLFIDDNPSNRGEAEALIPGLRVCDETIIGSLLSDELCRGENDPEFTRLKNYKVLEQKAAHRSSYHCDVGGFLRASNISVTIEHEIDGQLDRIVEILNRTNQLNFTKRRLSEDRDQAIEDLKTQLDTFGTRAGIVRVVDKYGDYGIVGFWAVVGVWGDARLTHFAFSCRILGMGVEQWVYDKLGSPRLDIIGSVVSKLDFVPDWINSTGAKAAERIGATLNIARLRGGCELEVLRHFFAFEAARVDTEFVFPRGAQTVWKSHIVSMLPQPAMQASGAREALERIGLMPEDFGSQILSAPETAATVLVISNSADTIVPVYRHKTHGFLVPVLVFELDDITKRSENDIDAYADRWNLPDEDRKALSTLAAELRENYAVLQPGDIDFTRDYRRLVDYVKADQLLIFLLHSTKDGLIVDPVQERVNAAIRKSGIDKPNVRWIDVAAHVKPTKRISDRSRFHLDREVCHSIFEEVMSLYAKWTADPAHTGHLNAPKPLASNAPAPTAKRFWNFLFPSRKPRGPAAEERS